MGANSRQWAATMRERLRLDHLAEDEILDAIVAGVVRMYREAPSPVIAGAPDAVRRIAATVPVAIASSSHRAVIEEAVHALGLRDVLGAIVSSDEVPRGKPDPDVYLLAAERLGVDPGRCLVVEDSLNGVRAGNAAGMFVVLVPNESVPPAEGARDLANRVLPRLADLDLARIAG
jgi:HAD superfamily hydrolase (TIGR01549 family)